MSLKFPTNVRARYNSRRTVVVGFELRQLHDIALPFAKDFTQCV